MMLRAHYDGDLDPRVDDYPQECQVSRRFIAGRRELLFDQLTPVGITKRDATPDAASFNLLGRVAKLTFHGARLRVVLPATPRDTERQPAGKGPQHQEQLRRADQHTYRRRPLQNRP